MIFNLKMYCGINIQFKHIQKNHKDIKRETTQGLIAQTKFNTGPLFGPWFS